MTELRKVRIQILDETTGEVLEEVNVMTAPQAVIFADGQNLTQKLEAIETTPGPEGPAGQAATVAVHSVITGEAGTQAAVENMGTANAAQFKFTIPKGDKGDKGDTGDTGAQGIPGEKGDKGDKGDPGDTVKVGVSLETGVQRKLFFKVVE